MTRAMLRRGPGDQSGGGGGGGEKGGALEAGVAEINNSVCSAMLGMVLSDEALRCRPALCLRSITEAVFFTGIST